ncbi:UNKNOWN [Stylonychia lemnae]|uniref:Metal-dependent HD superfamily phosphohydrolase n=1 Tax=Stylonychia lemnae TaxID=5949 RepID=A0A077ZRM7_STYLE|nr:UNKNOWN [Stylonychia lemnae]|eukprot:CDW71990.1 UNKNOWN [Stylonychia lemnae]
MELAKAAKHSVHTLNQLQRLEQKWLQLHKLYIQQASSHTQQQWWNKFTQLYHEPQRFYHNLYHLNKLYDFYELNILQSNPELLKSDSDHSTFLLSLWFHDAIYDPKQKDNEEQSAALFNQYVNEINLPEAQAKLVQNIIMATVKHQIDSSQLTSDQDIYLCGVFLDADLSVLGWETSDYNEYAERIWQEYSFYGWEPYCKGRAAVLNKMLEKESLYFTKEIRDSLEGKARQNIREEIARLEKGERLDIHIEM